MPIEVEIPGKGIAEFPDGMSTTDMETAIFERFPDLAEASPRAANKFELLKQRKAALSAESPSVAGTFVDEVSQPFFPIPKPETEEDDIAVTRFAKGLGQAGVGVIEGIESPLGASVIAASALPGVGSALSKAATGVASKALPVAGKVVGTTAAAGFTGLMGYHGLKDIYDSIKEGDAEKAGRGVGTLIAAALPFAAMRRRGQPESPKASPETADAIPVRPEPIAKEIELLPAETKPPAIPGEPPPFEPITIKPEPVSEFTPVERAVLPKSVEAAEQIKPTTEVQSAILKTSEEISRDVRQPEVAPESTPQVPVTESRAATPEAPLTSDARLRVSVEREPDGYERTTYFDPDGNMVGIGRRAGEVLNYVEVFDPFKRRGYGKSILEDLRNRGGKYAVAGTESGEALLRASGYVEKEGRYVHKAVEESRAPIVEAPIEESVFRPEALQTPSGETVGIAPRGGMMPSPEAAGRFFRKYFTKEEGFPEEVHALRGEMAGAKTRIDRDIAYASRSLMDSLGEVYGIGRLGKLGGGSRKIPPQAVQLMDDYIRGRVANPNAIPAEIRGPLDNFRAQMDSWSNEVIDTLQRQLNRLPPQSAEAQALANRIDKIRNDLGIYAHRSYKFFDSSSPAPDWYQKLPAGDRLAAEDYLMQNAPQAMTREQAQSKLLDWLSDLKPTGEPTGRAAKVGAMDLTQFLRRKVIPEELRAVLGEYRNPLVNYAKSVSNMADFVAKQKFLEETKRVGMGRFLFEEGQNPPGFNARIASEGTESMSPLSGLRTSQEIADAFAQLDRVPVKNNLWRTYLLLNAQTKIAATVQSVLTQSRNLLSRPMMAMFAGHFDPRPIPNAVKTMFADVIDKPGAREAYLQRAAELQLTGGHASSGEVIALLKDAALQDVAPAELHQWSLLRAVKKVGWDIPAKIYRASDDLGNLVAWENEIASQRKINPQKTRSELEVDAAEIVREIYPTYSETPRVVKAMRHIPFGPFVTFSYQIVRSAVNASRRATRELQSSNPAERIVGAKRAAGIAGALTLGFGLQEMSKAMLGISTQEEDDFRSFQPDWAKNSKWAFTGKDPTTGQLSAVNLSYIDPYSYLSDPVMGLVSGIRSDQDALDVTARLMSESLRPWASEQMLAGAVADSMRNTTKTGSKIYQETDSFDEKSLKIARHIGKTLLPGTVQRLNRRIIPAFKGEQPSYGRKLEPGPEIARELTGVAIEQFDFRNGLAYKAGEFLQRERDAEEGFRRSASTYKTISPEQLLSDYTEMDTRRFEIWKQMRGHFLAAVRRGVSVKEAKELLTSKGVSKDDARFIERGIYKPFEPSAELQKKARDAKHPLPMAEIRNVLRARNRQRLDPEK